MIAIDKKYKTAALISFLVVFSLMTGCVARVADLTLISTKNIDLSNANLDARKGRRVQDQDCAISLLGLFPLGVPNLEEAIDNALDKGHGNIMVDQVSYRKFYYYIIASTNCIEVKGTVLNVANLNIEKKHSNYDSVVPLPLNKKHKDSSSGAAIKAKSVNTTWRYKAGKFANSTGCMGLKTKQPSLDLILKNGDREAYVASCADGSHRRIECDSHAPCEIIQEY